VERVEPGLDARRRGNKQKQTKGMVYIMAQIQITYLLRPGTQERWRRLCQELAELRLDKLETCWRQAGITQVQVRLVQLLRGELMLITLHTQEPQQTLQGLATSKCPFDRWLREQLQALLGWNLQEVLADPQGDLIFIWPAERSEGEAEVSSACDWLAERSEGEAEVSSACDISCS
jgi:hypothetical protein